MNALMSNLPADQKIVLNPNTGKPLVRGNNGQFMKTTPANDYQQNTSQPPPIINNINPVRNTLNQTPQGYAGIPGKEQAPNVEEIYLEDAQKTEELKEQLAELEKTAEVKEIKGEVELPEIVKQAGVKQAGEEIPVTEEPPVSMPLPDDKIYSTVKKSSLIRRDTSSSLIWLGWWCWRQLSALHIKLKDVHGKIIRQTGR